MNLIPQIFAQALLLAGELEARQEVLLNLLCRSAAGALEARLRKGLTSEDCKADFVAAAGLYALAALSEVADTDTPEEFTAGDVTLRRKDSGAAANCLRYQAELMMAPYLKDRFEFRGV